MNISNESDEPVFDVSLIVGIGHPVTAIGPLAAPVPIPVLPAHSKRNWDISMGLLAHSGGIQLPAEPVALVRFTDAQGVRWRRAFDGLLVEQTGIETKHLMSEDEEVSQLGSPGNGFNPLVVALPFFDMLMHPDTPPSRADLEPFLAESAPGWHEVDDQQIEFFRTELIDYGMATHVAYPAPHVAYVRLVHESDQNKHPSKAGYTVIRAKIITLIFYAGIGWRIFGLGDGATQPDWISFPPGTLDDNPRGSESTV